MSELGILIVVSGPSGVGKGTLCDILIKRIKRLFLSISATTRPPRKGEINGVDYVFMSHKGFEDNIKKGLFLEWAKVYGNYYGTPKDMVFKQLNKGNDVILEIDIQGAAQVKRKYPEGIFVFISPPNIQELKNRIIKRGSDSQKSIESRLKCARIEMEASHNYDYIIINDDLDKAVLLFQSIVLAEKCKISRNSRIIEAIIGGIK